MYWRSIGWVLTDGDRQVHPIPRDIVLRADPHRTVAIDYCTGNTCEDCRWEYFKILCEPVPAKGPGSGVCVPIPAGNWCGRHEGSFPLWPHRSRKHSFRWRCTECDWCGEKHAAAPCPRATPPPDYGDPPPEICKKCNYDHEPIPKITRTYSRRPPRPLSPCPYTDSEGNIVQPFFKGIKHPASLEEIAEMDHSKRFVDHPRYRRSMILAEDRRSIRSSTRLDMRELDERIRKEGLTMPSPLPPIDWTVEDPLWESIPSQPPTSRDLSKFHPSSSVWSQAEYVSSKEDGEPPIKNAKIDSKIVEGVDETDMSVVQSGNDKTESQICVLHDVSLSDSIPPFPPRRGWGAFCLSILWAVFLVGFLTMFLNSFPCVQAHPVAPADPVYDLIPSINQVFNGSETNVDPCFPMPPPVGECSYRHRKLGSISSYPIVLWQSIALIISMLLLMLVLCRLQQVQYDWYESFSIKAPPPCEKTCLECPAVQVLTSEFDPPENVDSAYSLHVLQSDGQINTDPLMITELRREYQNRNGVDRSVGFAIGMTVFRANVLCDTGADISLIDSRLLERMNAPIIPVSKDEKKILLCDTRRLSFVGKVQGLLYLAGFAYEVTFYVQEHPFPHTTYSIILGHDFLHTIGSVSIDYQAKTLKIDDLRAKARFVFKLRSNRAIITTFGPETFELGNVIIRSSPSQTILGKMDQAPSDPALFVQKPTDQNALETTSEKLAGLDVSAQKKNRKEHRDARPLRNQSGAHIEEIIEKTIAKARDVVEARKIPREAPKLSDPTPDRVEQILDNQKLIARQFPPDSRPVKGLKGFLSSTKQVNTVLLDPNPLSVIPLPKSPEEVHLSSPLSQSSVSTDSSAWGSDIAEVGDPIDIAREEFPTKL